MTNYVVFDTETTGIEPGSRLLELAAVHFNEDGAILKRFEMLVNPGMPLPADAAAVNGITTEMVAASSSAGVAIIAFLGWLPPQPTLIAHNAAFDCGIIAWESQRAGIQFPYQTKVIDTLTLAKVIKATPNNKLQTLVEHYNLNREGNAHRAMADSYSCMWYYLWARTLGEPASVEFELTGYDYGYPDDLPPILGNLPRLVETGTPLTMTYKDAKDNVTERTIIPYGWAQKKDAIHIHGMDSLRGERRTFRSDRIISVEAA